MWLRKDENGWTWRRSPGWPEYVLAAFVIPALLFGLGVVLAVISVWCFPLYELVWPGKPGAGLLGLPSALQVLMGLGWLFVTALAREFTRFLLAMLGEALAGGLRGLCGESVALAHDGVTRWLSLGPWRQERRARRQDVVDVDAGGMEGFRVLLASGETLKLNPYVKGHELPPLLQEVLGVPSDAELLASRVPPGWQRRELPDGALALEPTRWRGGQEARWHVAMSVLFALGAGLVALRLDLEDGGRWGRLAFVLGLGGMAVWDALRAWSHWRGRCRLEVQPGALVYVDRGILRTRSTRYAPATLVLEREEDHEGSATHDLRVAGPGASQSLATRSFGESVRPLLHLGHWLARNLGVTLQGAPASPSQEEGSRKQASAPERHAG